MSLIWENRIKGKKGSGATLLHEERYAAWLTYIDKYWPEKKIWSRIEIKHNQNDADKKWLPPNQWKKITVINKRTKNPYVVFDASFGSVAETSDFDVVVKCTEVAPLEKWITFLGDWHAKHKRHIFTNYFDSNFYFEPSYMTSNKTLISFMNKRMISKEMEPVHNKLAMNPQYLLESTMKFQIFYILLHL